MKKPMWLPYSLLLLAGLAWLDLAAPARAQEGGGPAVERVERLERRVNEMAERQEQFMRRLGEQMERQAELQSAGGANRPPFLATVATPSPAVKPLPGVTLAKSLRDMLGLLFLVGILCNILLSIWIFTDIRKRGEGSGLFIALALVAGIPAAIIYTLTRIGDKKT